MPKKNALEIVYNALRDGPLFPQQIPLPTSARNYALWYRQCRLARSTRFYRLPGQSCVYAYARPEQAGQLLTWRWNGQEYRDYFSLREQRESSPLSNNNMAFLQAAITDVLREHGALFSNEIHERVKQIHPNCKLSGVKNALTKMVRKGQVLRFDEHHGGWKFARGYLYAAPDQPQAFNERLSNLNLFSDRERAVLTRCRRAIWLARDLRHEQGINEAYLGWIMRKLAKEAPYRVEKAGSGWEYRIEVKKDQNRPLEGRGLISWLRWVNLFGQIVLYDEEHVPESELIEFLKAKGYWLSGEGLRRQEIGREWENYIDHFFNLCDKRGLWQLRVLDHHHNWRGRWGREFDHIYVCQLGPKQLGLTVTLIFECKSGIIKADDVDHFYQSVINEPEFRNWMSGGQKANVVLIMVTGKTAERTALQKAAKMGIRIVMHTDVEDIIAELTGERKTFYKIVQEISSPNAL